MRTSATDAESYLTSLPEDRRAALEALRKLILKNLPRGYEEAFDFGMLSYQVPLSVYPDTYNKKPMMYAALASQKNHMAVYLCAAYALPGVQKKLEAGFEKAGKKLDMGKSCVRFKRIEDISLPAIGEVIASTPMADYIAFTRSVHSPEAKAERTSTRKAAPAKAMKASVKKPAASKSSTKR